MTAIPVSHESPPDCCGRRVKRQEAAVELPGEIVFNPSFEACASGLFPYPPRAPKELPEGLCRKEKVTRML